MASEVRTGEAITYYLRRGFGPLLRGLFLRWQFKSCRSPLFISRGCRFYFPRFISLGSGVSFGPDCTINGLSKKGMKIGNHVHFREYVSIQATSRLDDPGEGLEIGDNTYIAPYVYMGAGGGIRIGKDVAIGMHVHLLAENHHFDDISQPIREQGVSRKGIVIGDDVWIGNHTVILDGVEIGKGCVIGAGSVVTRSLPAGSVAAGNPARVLKTRGQVQP